MNTPTKDQNSEQELMREPRFISNSEIQSFKRCRRKWWLNSYRRLDFASDAPTGARQLGSRVHLALAGWYVPDGGERVDPLETLRRVLAEDIDTFRQANPDMDDETAAAVIKQFDSEADLARAMLEGYMEWITDTGADMDFEVIAPEKSLKWEVLPGVWLVGRLDAVIRRVHDGVVFFIDHKTTPSFANLTQRLRQDEQMLTYEMLQRLIMPDGVPIAGAVYNMLRKVKRTARAKPPFYERTEVLHNVHELRAFWHRTLGTIEEILRAGERLDSGEDPMRVAYPTPSKDCSWDCDFAAVCPMFDDGSRAEDLVAQFYTVRPRNNRYEDLTDDKHTTD